MKILVIYMQFLELSADAKAISKRSKITAYENRF